MNRVTLQIPYLNASATMIRRFTKLPDSPARIWWIVSTPRTLFGCPPRSRARIISLGFRPMQPTESPSLSHSGPWHYLHSFTESQRRSTLCCFNLSNRHSKEKSHGFWELPELWSRRRCDSAESAGPRRIRIGESIVWHADSVNRGTPRWSTICKTFESGGLAIESSSIVLTNLDRWKKVSIWHRKGMEHAGDNKLRGVNEWTHEW
jgi:hypothetical protein